jgi:hypothetical protein
MPFVLVLVLVVVVVVVIAFLALTRGGAAGRWGRERAAAHEELAGPASTLDYEVPAGQDPALLVAALREEGYEAAPDPHRTNLLHIECPSGPDRERSRVRATLGAVRSTAIDAGAPMDPGPVRFVDER